MFKNKNAAAFGVIGLGRFGTALAKSLIEAGKEVLVIDNSPSKVQELRQFTEHAFLVEELNHEALVEAGVQNCDTVIICIGEKIDTSILVTLNVVNLGVPNVIAKAISEEQGAVLEKIGADVVYPEKDMALRLAKRLVSYSVLDYISLTNDIEISELMITNKLIGKSVLDLDIRKKYGLNIIAIEHKEGTTIEINPDYIFAERDIIVVIGTKDKLKSFETFLV